MNEIYIKILAERAKQDSTLLAKLAEEVRVEVEKYLEEQLKNKKEDEDEITE